MTRNQHQYEVDEAKRRALETAADQIQRARFRVQEANAELAERVQYYQFLLDALGEVAVGEGPRAGLMRRCAGPARMRNADRTIVRIPGPGVWTGVVGTVTAGRAR